MGLRLALAFAFALAGCVSADPRGASAAEQSGPTAEELRSAMLFMALGTIGADGITSVDVPGLTHHLCAPTGLRNRFRCCYVNERGQRGTAVVELLPADEAQDEGRWLLVDSARYCSTRF